MSLPMYTVECNYGAESTTTAKLIIQNLRKVGLYRPDLMYRGVNVQPEDIQKISQYGTDRTPEDITRKQMESVDQDLDFLDDLDLAHKQEWIGECTDPRLIWAFPQKGMHKCIESYALNGDGAPVILAYKPESLLYYGSYPCKDRGLEVTKIPARRLNSLPASIARYIFKEGIEPIDVAVAGHVISFSRKARK